MPPDQVLYLHGDLQLHIISARNLPNMDILSDHFRKCVCTPASGDQDGPADPAAVGRRRSKTITGGPYVSVKVPHATVARTHVIKNSRAPTWNQRFDIPLAHPLLDLEFHVKDDDLFGAELVGVAKIPAADIAAGKPISGWFDLSAGKTKKNNNRPAAIHLELKFTPADRNPIYTRGIAGEQEHGVRDTYFPLRKGSSVTLYQDAHAPEGLLPSIELDGGRVYKQGSCWEDLCYAISEAHHLIYVVGWSVFYKIKLIREPTRPLPRGGDLTLGELLKYKSEEGVRVLMLVWDDKTSQSKFFIKTGGIMKTHDEDTRKFFKHSSVNCVLAPRYASSKLGYMKQKVVGTMFSHHQKFVLVDTQATGNNRKITAFLGGLDLCDGRYDTSEHRLFQDLDTVFKGDFHNPTYSESKAPRQPWHDLHCKIDGPAAYDVLINFEQRWRKATRWREFSVFFKGKSHWNDDALIKIERISWILSPIKLYPEPEPPSNLSSLIKKHKDKEEDRVTVIPKDNPVLYVSREDDPNNWHVQIFRSIDSGSLRGFPTKGDYHLGNEKNLIYTKDVVVDRSIQTAYIQAIRSAQHFIYIENQYFLGSSYGWSSYKNAGVDNLIPMELALKIASKIRARERFAVYIVIPMWPEGDPKSNTVQEILFWQYQTMQMMYEVIARVLKDEAVDAHPQDYLNFYCLGKREETPKDDVVSDEVANGTTVSKGYKSQRFMIYVHAKGMIVDDEYVIIGSANINQRSLAGTKDSEIAMGAYQPHHTWANKTRHPRGQVYGYRMSLWAEHLNTVKQIFEEPERLECVKKVNEIAESNWRDYSDDSFKLLHGHLLKYPLGVGKDGKVSPLPGSENFPDVGGKVIGATSIRIPDILTT